VIRGHLSQIRDLLLPRLMALVVIKVPGVIANLVDVWSDFFSQPIVLLQINRQTGVSPSPNLAHSVCVPRTVDRDAHNIRTRLVQSVDLIHRRRYVLRMRGGHTLHGYRMTSADRDGADANSTGWIAGQLHEWFLWVSNLAGGPPVPAAPLFFNTVFVLTMSPGLKVTRRTQERLRSATGESGMGHASTDPGVGWRRVAEQKSMCPAETN
jgi:hypothetical protein